MNSPNLVGYWQLDDNAISCRDYSLQHANATLGASPSTPLWNDFGAPIIPEFPSFLILPLFMIATLLAITFHKKKRPRQKS